MDDTDRQVEAVLAAERERRARMARNELEPADEPLVKSLNRLYRDLDHAQRKARTELRVFEC